MMSATFCGRDMKGAWLEATERTLAPIRLARNSCAGGGIIWSSVQVRYQEGIVFQAGAPLLPAKLARLSGLCTAAMTAASVAVASAANAVWNPARLIHRKPCASGGRARQPASMQMQNVRGDGPAIRFF
jgi:hypothetical protein